MRLNRFLNLKKVQYMNNGLNGLNALNKLQQKWQRLKDLKTWIAGK